MNDLSRSIFLALAKQYTSIGGQAVIEGVMMRSPNTFVIAVRKPDGTIRLRRDQWFGISKKIKLLKKPFFRGIVMLFEAMANGIVSLNYSANVSMNEELKNKNEQIDWKIFLTVAVSFAFGMGLFVFVPHAATAGLDQLFNLNWSLDGLSFHLVDGLIKAFIFVLYIWLIGFLPDIKRVFQYHGAEHKSISTFEAGEELEVENAIKHATLHPRCGTSFIFFLLIVSILAFSVLFAAFPVGENLPPVLKHVAAIFVKILFMFPIAGISYEIIKFAGKHPENSLAKALSFPGMMLQKLTTREPDREQLEVALCSIRAALVLEEKFNLKDASEKALSLEEVDINSLEDLERSDAALKDFLE